MTKLLSLFILIVLYVAPFILIYYFKNINRFVKKFNSKLKASDVINIWLVFGIYYFSQNFFTSPFFILFLLVIALIGLGVVYYFHKKLQYINYVKIIRVWWRFVFLVALVFYSILGLLAVWRAIF